MERDLDLPSESAVFGMAALAWLKRDRGFWPVNR
jgi:hypothetical protein